jgi:hypothetical protein
MVVTKITLVDGYPHLGLKYTATESSLHVCWAALFSSILSEYTPTVIDRKREAFRRGTPYMREPGWFELKNWCILPT